MEDLTANYVTKLEKTSADKIELLQNLDDLRDDYMELLPNLPVG